MKTKIYAGFPGVGKSHFFQNVDREIFPKVSDSDSSHFSWLVKEDGSKVRHPDFPANYVDHIKSLIEQEYNIIFVSTHKEVVAALKEAGIEFTIIAPDRALKSFYLGRYEKRGSPQGFIDLIDAQWENFLDDIYSSGVPVIALTNPDSYISHFVGMYGTTKHTTDKSLEILNH